MAKKKIEKMVLWECSFCGSKNWTPLQAILAGAIIACVACENEHEDCNFSD